MVLPCPTFHHVPTGQSFLLWSLKATDESLHRKHLRKDRYTGILPRHITGTEYGFTVFSLCFHMFPRVCRVDTRARKMRRIGWFNPSIPRPMTPSILGNKRLQQQEATSNKRIPTSSKKLLGGGHRK